MNAAPAAARNAPVAAASSITERHAAEGVDPAILSEIYQEHINIAIWKRHLSESLTASVSAFLVSNPTFKLAMSVTPQRVLATVGRALGTIEQPELTANIAALVDMYCCLFDLHRVGLRLTALDTAMCPKFHADRVTCRLVTTYQGVATQWLPHRVVNRSKLGAGCNGLADHESGLYAQESDIQQLGCGAVALLKGECWQGNENAGLVHRSPALYNGQYRLLLSLDFAQ